MKSKLVKVMSMLIAVIFAVCSLAGCAGSSSVDGSETAVDINAEGIPFGEINIYLRYQQAQSYYYMTALGFSSDSMWDSDYTYNVDENGNVVSDDSDDEDEDEETSESSTQITEVTTSYGEYFKLVVLDDFAEYVIARQKAINEYNLELSDEDIEQIEESAQEFVDANEDLEESYGTTLEMVKDFFEMVAYKSMLKDYATEDVDREVSDEEAAQSTLLYIRISKNSDSEDEEAEEDEDTKTNSELLADAEEVLALFKEAGDIDSDEANDMADEINESFFAMEYSYGSDRDIFPEEVYDALDTLEDGEIYDGVIDTDSYYYMVKMIAVFDEEATETERESIISTRVSEAYSEILEQWKAESSIEEKSCWTKLEITDNEIYTVAS